MILNARPSDPGCQCPSVMDRLHAGLLERELSPCAVHDAVSIAQHEARVHADQLHQVIAETKANDELARRRREREERLQQFEDEVASIEDPLEQAVVRRIYSSAPLNAPLSNHPSLAGFQPDDAA